MLTDYEIKKAVRTGLDVVSKIGMGARIQSHPYDRELYILTTENGVVMTMDVDELQKFSMPKFKQYINLYKDSTCGGIRASHVYSDRVKAVRDGKKTSAYIKTVVA